MCVPLAHDDSVCHMHILRKGIHPPGTKGAPPVAVIRSALRNTAISIVVTIAGLIVIFLFVGPSTVTPWAPPVDYACDSAYSTQALTRLIGTMKLPLSDAPIKLFKLYDYRANPNLGKTGVLFGDSVSPCEVTAVTNHGEVPFTYGWKKIDRDNYISARIDVTSMLGGQ
jgi:hypothetical protein